MEIQNQITKHPNGLGTLFFTEMWERFSYYGMRALLVLYLVNHLQYTDKEAGHLYGIYTSLVYLTPLIGGYLADRYLGHLKSVYLGSFLMILGHFSLALETEVTFFLGLALLILGNGFFKPNISTLLGSLYRDRPGLQDSGFTIFYMGINLGALFGPIVTGSLADYIGWHYGFGVAGVGMVLGVLIFRLGAKSFAQIRALDYNHQVKDQSVETKDNFERIVLILVMAFFSIFFWMAFEQMGSSMNLFADRYTDRVVFGFEIPTAWLQSVNPLFILLFAPLTAELWRKLGIANKDPHPLKKFSMAMFILGLGFLVLVWASWGFKEGEKMGLFYLVFAYFWNTISELFLSPTGLSFVNKTAPAAYSSLLMGAWFSSNAIAHYLGGLFSGLMEEMGSYSQFFLLFVITSWAGGLVLYLFGIWFLKKNPRLTQSVDL